MSNQHRVLWLVPVVLCGLGCGLFAPEKDDGGDQPVPPPEEKAPISEAAVLDNLETAHLRKNIDIYDRAIGDGFVFVPNAADGVPFNFLTEEQDRSSTLNMFNAVEEIDMQLVFGSPQEPDIAPYASEPNRYSQLEVADVAIRVQTREGAAGDPLIYLVQGDVARFIFERDSTATPNTYTIVYQADLGSGRLGDFASLSR